MEQIIVELKALFDEARQRNEFEFVLTLINYRGIGKEDITNLYEWFDAIDSYKGMYATLTSKKKTRIGALLYCTFFENNDFYNIIGSLCKISLGYRGSSYLYYKARKQERLLGTGEKIDLILELLNDCGKHELITFFTTVHVKQIRNSFFHSAYSLMGDYYIMHDTEEIEVAGQWSRSFDVPAYFYPKVEAVIAYFDAFKSFFWAAHKSYTRNKAIVAYFPTPHAGEILGSDDGLQGVVVKNTAIFYGIPADSSIVYDKRYDMWMANNIRITGPDREAMDLADQLSRYEAKADIRLTDAEFNSLVETITDRNIPGERYRAAKLLIKFGSLMDAKAMAETNPFKRKSLIENTLSYYRRTLALASDMTTPELPARIALLEKELDAGAIS
jgi:hypothetical protein